MSDSDNKGDAAKNFGDLFDSITESFETCFDLINKLRVRVEELEKRLPVNPTEGK